MTSNDVFNLSISKPYKFEFYTGQILKGFIIQDFTNTKNYIIPINKIKAYNESKGSDEEKISQGIYIEVNINNIDHWEECNK